MTHFLLGMLAAFGLMVAWLYRANIHAWVSNKFPPGS